MISFRLLLVFLLLELSLQLSVAQVEKRGHDIHLTKPAVKWTGPAPGLRILAKPLNDGAWLVSTEVSGFKFSPEDAGRKHLPGHGHIHLYVSGKKHTRLYGQPYYLYGLSNGRHELEVTLNTNDHRNYQFGGKNISSKIIVNQIQKSLTTKPKSKKLVNDPGLSVMVKRDLIHGWNVVVESSGYDFNNGWASLDINGNPAGRVYGGYHYLSDFLPERDALSVTLYDAQGRICMYDGKPVAKKMGKAHQLRWFATSVQAHPVNRKNGLVDPELSLAYDDQLIYIKSNGIPVFQFVQRTPNPIEMQTYNWEIPRYPKISDKPQQIPLLGLAAILTVGLPVYGPNEAQHPHPFGDPLINEALDYCHGHTAGRGDYHFHYAPTCLLKTPDGKEEHYNVVGYSLDGYPIVAHYLSVLDEKGDPILDSNGEFQFNWQEVSGYEPNDSYRREVLNGTKTSTYVWEQYKYMANRPDRTLDECNGRRLNKRKLASGEEFDEREFFQSDYAYFLTGEFPYVLSKYKGEAKVRSGRRSYNREQGGRRRDSSRRR
ncbi:MAG: hypothetical protein CMO77_08220 [Verrucomicrobiales bacterium]|nr:hypothetical protein [Verrucomicrobiales bacterium]